MLTASQTAAIIFTALLTVILPLALMLFARRNGGRWTAFFTGGLTFILFAMVLEQGLHALVLNSPLAPALTGNMWLYGIYGGLAAGVFEETGRLAAFLIPLKRQREPSAALAYGAGHGGIEAVLLVGMTMINNLMVSAMAANNSLPDPTLQVVADTLAATHASMYLWAAWERVSAIGLHMALSVLVFAAVRKKRYRLYALAILLHAGVDFLAIILNACIPLPAMEIIVMGLSILIVLWAAKVWHSLPSGESREVMP